MNLSETQNIWQELLEYLEQKLTKPNFQIVINSVAFDSFYNNILSLKVNNSYSQKWVKDHCENDIKAYFKDTDILIEYQIHTESPPKEQLELFTQIQPTQSAPKALIESKFNFDNFIVGNNNRFAHAASLAISDKPAEAYNPLFIYGPVGVGKTHLLKAICEKISRLHPHLNSKLVTSEKFTNDLINALKNKQTKQFKESYRNIDILLIDDIQFLAGKEATQEEFFHTFNSLHSSNKQIVFTSDRPPKDIPTLQERLSTRFAWGLIADIQPPELETRIAILKNKAELKDIYIADEVLHYIATQIPMNIRELEGGLNKIIAYASLLNTEITLSMASNIIRDMVKGKEEQPITVNQIQRKTAQYFSITVDDIVGKKRTKDLAFYRQICMYLSRELTSLSLPKIGEHFGNRDHSTIMHACDKIKLSMENDQELKSNITQLINVLKNTD